jgi:zinc transporter
MIAEVETRRYGSEKTGLICGYVFEPGQAGHPADADEACDTLAGRASGFAWLHFNLANQASLRWLRQRVSLPDAFYESLQQATSTRLEVAGDSVVAVINDATVFGLETCEVATLSVCVNARLLISARHTPLRSIDRLRDAVRAGERFQSPLDLLAHLLRDQADILAQIVRAAAVDVDALEDRLFANQIATSRPRLGAIRRMLVRLQRLLAPEPSALFRLLSRPLHWVRAGDVDQLRQAAEELASSVGDCVALVERVRLLQEEASAAIDEQTNRTLFILTGVTVIALPMTIIPGFLGMNVGGIPLRESAAGFWIVLAFVLGLAGLGVVLLMRSRRDV